MTAKNQSIDIAHDLEVKKSGCSGGKGAAWQAGAAAHTGSKTASTRPLRIVFPLASVHGWHAKDITKGCCITLKLQRQVTSSRLPIRFM